MIAKRIYSSALAIALTSTATIAADQAENITEIFAKGSPTLDLRYRLALIDQDGFARDATASILRTKFGFKTATFHGFSAYAEVENSVALGAEKYNDTLNGNTQYPVVADPESTEMNQYYLMYQHKSGGWAKVGRQGINLGTQRFVGTVGWRQNDQTYDAAAVGYKKGKIDARYYYVWNVNRIFSDDSPVGNFDTETHIFNASYTFSPLLKAEVNGLLLDQNTNFPAINQNLSSQTYTAKISGSKQFDGVKLGYAFEYGNQSDYATSALDYSADYYNAEISATFKGVTLKVGQELLGSDNGKGFTTPLATLHKFNGFADKFLGTPAQGLEDSYITMSYTMPESTGMFKGIKSVVTYHDFKSDIGDINYGDEWNFLVSKKLNKHFSAAIKGAIYNADEFATDTNKFWLILGAKF